MNTDIANILKDAIATVAFADKVAGLVRPLSFTNTDEDSKTFKKKIPVACNVTYQDCIKGKYTDLVPNSKYKSVMYFEDQGLNVTGFDGANWSYQSNLRLVCWLNQKKLGKTNCSVSALAIANILKVLPTKIFNSPPYSKIQIELKSEIVKGPDIFSKYTYEEEKQQFLIFPYDYFALDLEVKFTMHKDCADAWVNEPEICDNK